MSDYRYRDHDQPHIRRGSDPSEFRRSHDGEPQYSDQEDYPTSRLQSTRPSTSVYSYGSSGGRGTDGSIRSRSYHSRSSATPSLYTGTTPSVLSNGSRHPPQYTPQSYPNDPYRELRGGPGSAAVPRMPDPNEGFPCLLWFNSCYERLSFHNWIPHVNEHLMHRSPEQSECGVCGKIYDEEVSAEANWQKLLVHIMGIHYNQSAEPRPVIQPPDCFIEYLEEEELITPAVAQRVRYGHATPLPPTSPPRSRRHGNGTPVQYYDGPAEHGEGFEAITRPRWSHTQPPSNFAPERSREESPGTGQRPRQDRTHAHYNYLRGMGGVGFTQPRTPPG